MMVSDDSLLPPQSAYVPVGGAECGLDYNKYYDVSVDCPKNMGKYQDFNTHAHFHGAYLRALFEAKNITYSNKRPGDVLKAFYLEQLLTRIQVQPEQLTTFRQFIDFCNMVKSKLPS